MYRHYIFIHSSVDGHLLLLLSLFSPQTLASSRTQFSECLTCITAFNLHLQPGSKARRYQTPFLHMGALRFRDAKESAECHTAPWRQRQNQTPRPRRHTGTLLSRGVPSPGSTQTPRGGAAPGACLELHQVTLTSPRGWQWPESDRDRARAPALALFCPTTCPLTEKSAASLRDHRLTEVTEWPGLHRTVG